MSVKSFDEYKDAPITKEDLFKALNDVKYDKSVVLDMIDKHPDMIKTLVDAKDNEGKPLFDAQAIDDVLFNCKDTIEKHPDRITAVLNNPEEIASITKYNSRGAGLWRAVGEPLSSTIERNPEAFGMKPKNEEIAKENNTNNAKLLHLKKLIESRKMTKDIKQGMDKSTPIKQVDANAPFDVMATKTSKTSER